MSVSSEVSVRILIYVMPLNTDELVSCSRECEQLCIGRSGKEDMCYCDVDKVIYLTPDGETCAGKIETKCCSCCEL